MSKITVSEGDTTASTERFSGYRIGYARVSTREQDEALQHDALTAAGCEWVFVDRVSGKLEHRPAATRCSTSCGPVIL